MKKVKIHVSDYSNINVICCLDSVYSLLLYLLLEPAPIKNTLFIFGKGVYSNVYSKFENYIIVDHPLYNRMEVYLWRIYFYFFFQKIIKKHKLINCPIYGHDFLRWTDYFVASAPSFYVLEDGIGNYTSPNIYLKRYQKNLLFRFFYKHLSFLNLPYGLSKNVQKVYLTGLFKTPNAISEKVEIINTKKLWKEKNNARKNEILKIYSIDQNLIDKFNNTKRDILLLTQPFSESNIMNEHEKISLYKDMTKDYDISRFIIKTHPREETDYSIYFPDALIITDRFPIQLLFFFDLKINKIITFNSTAIYSLPEGYAEKVIYKPISLK